MLGRTNLVVPKLLTNTKLRIHRHQGSSVCGVQHRHAHARTRVHTHPQRSRTLTNAYRHSTPCKKLTEREKTGSFPHLQGENREKKGVFTPKQRQGAPKRTTCQDKCPEGETGIPVCLWSGQGDWPRAHQRRGKERIEKWQGAGRGQPACHHWHPKEVSFQCVTWRLRKGAGLELCCWYRKIWLQKEKIPDLFPAHTLRGARGETDRAGTGGGSVGWQRSAYSKFHTQESVQGGLSLRNRTPNSCLDAYRWTSVVHHCESRGRWWYQVRNTCPFPCLLTCPIQANPRRQKRKRYPRDTQPPLPTASASSSKRPDTGKGGQEL